MKISNYSFNHLHKKCLGYFYCCPLNKNQTNIFEHLCNLDACWNSFLRALPVHEFSHNIDKSRNKKIIRSL